MLEVCVMENVLSQEPLVRIVGVKKYFPDKKPFFFKSAQQVRAVDGVTFDIYPGETLGLVGESGCGKSTLGRQIVGLIPPTEGSIYFDGTDMSTLRKDRGLKQYRRKVQFIFQDPSASLNPRKTIREILLAPFRIHSLYSKAEREKRIRHLADIVGLASYHLTRYPHELSGGQKQRVGVGRALALEPKLIICDEPLSALDVSVQAQVINLLEDLQVEFQLTLLFISHDLSVVHHISDRVVVMYLGKIMEVAGNEDLYTKTLHPYSKALLSANPAIDLDPDRSRIILKGDLPSNTDPPRGCRFNTRCPEVFDKCREIEPTLKKKRPNHLVACHLHDD